MRNRIALFILMILLASCGSPSTSTIEPTAETVLETTLPLISATSSPPTPAASTATPSPSNTAQSTGAVLTETPEPEASAVVRGGNATASPTPPTAVVMDPLESPNRNRVVDHLSLALFDQIPEEYLAAARALRMVYVDASVGQNINEGLDCLAAPSWRQSPAACRRDYVNQPGGEWKTFNQIELESNLVPQRIRFDPDSARYDRSNWTFVAMPALWDTILRDFVVEIVPEYVNQKDVLSYQFNYLHVAPDSPIADAEEGFFVDQPRQGFYPNRDRWDISDMEALEAQYPEKTFIYWTTSLSRAIGSNVSTQFNNQMRAYAAANNKYLFDVADILSHDALGQPCYDNRDGVEFCGVNGCENHPDDGHYYPAICQDYTTETEGGHLGSVSAGKIRLAQGFWILMALIAGWQP